MNTKGIAIRIIAVALFVSGVYLTYYQATRPNQLGFWGDQFPFIYFIMTVLVLGLGIIFGCLFRQIKVRGTKKIRIVDEIQEVFSSASFWAALCVSPFVLFTVYAVVSSAPGDPASYLLAFQNGFFCESVFNQLFKTPGESTGSAPSANA